MFFTKKKSRSSCKVNVTPKSKLTLICVVGEKYVHKYLSRVLCPRVGNFYTFVLTNEVSVTQVYCNTIGQDISVYVVHGDVNIRELVWENPLPWRPCREPFFLLFHMCSCEKSIPCSSFQCSNVRKCAVKNHVTMLAIAMSLMKFVCKTMFSTSIVAKDLNFKHKMNFKYVYDNFHFSISLKALCMYLWLFGLW